MARPRGTTAERKFGPRSGAAKGTRNSDTSAEFLLQKVRLVREQTDKLAMQVARLRGELVPADGVRERHEEILRMLHDRVMQVETVAPLLYAVARGSGGMEAVRTLLRKELRDALDLGPVWLFPSDGAA